MTPVEALAIAGAGAAAGTINTIVGSGSLITFPTLLAFGYPPVTANVSNTLGLVPGSTSGVIGYRRELAGQGRRVLRLGVFSASGGLTGAILLLALPATAFATIVPFLILLACVLVAVQPRLSEYLARHRPYGAEGSPALPLFVYLIGIYGGYFGAAQGVMLIAILAIFIPDDLQRLNALKNLLSLIVNGVAAVFFLVKAPIAWDAVVLIAVGSIVGGQIGAAVGRRLSPLALRSAIIVIGVSVVARMLT